MPDKNDSNKSKNIVHGDIKNVKGGVRIGDEYHTHIHPKTIPPRQLTAQFPTTPQDQIIGRKNDIEQVRQELITNQQVVLVNGIGGVGKTTLAQVYAHEYKEAYKHLAWINCLSQDFSSDVIQTANLLQNLNIDATGKDLKNLCLEVLNRLTNLADTPCLLIIDNAESDIINYINYLPKPPNWHVLMTSRQRFNVRHFKYLSLGFLSPEDAELLFLNHYKRSYITLDDIRELIRMVDYHTLTIEILAKTAQKQRSKMPELREALHTNLKTNVEIEHNDNQKIERITSYLVSIFNLSQLSTDELWLMQQFTCLPSDFHDYDTLLELIQPEKREQSKSIISRIKNLFKKNEPERLSFSELLGNLADKGWLLFSEDKYKMHRIIGEVIAQRQPPSIGDVLPLIENVIRKLVSRNVNPVEAFPWIPFGKTILNQFADNDTLIITDLQNNLAIVLQDFGDYKSAKSLLEKTVLSVEKRYGEQHTQTAIHYSNLAGALKDLGDYEEAKVFFTKSLNSFTLNFGENHPNTSTIQSNLAAVLQELGDYEGAKSLLKKAVHSKEQSLGELHPSTAISYSNLALVLEKLGKTEEAKLLFEKTMESMELNFGENHPHTAQSYSNLGTVLQKLGENERAKKLLEKALKAMEKNFGKHHPYTANCCSSLGLIYLELKSYSAAFFLSEKAYQIYASQLGESHPRTQLFKKNLAFVKSQM